MTALEYRAARNKLGISVLDSAKVLGISRATAYRYEAGQWDVPETVARLLRALVALGTTEV